LDRSAALAATTATLTGTVSVSGAGGYGAGSFGTGGLRARLVDRRVGEDLALAETLTDAGGRYELAYRLDQLGGTKTVADAQVRVFDGDRAPAGRLTRNGVRGASLPASARAAAHQRALAVIAAARVTTDRHRHRGHKIKSRQAFPHAPPRHHHPHRPRPPARLRHHRGLTPHRRVPRAGHLRAGTGRTRPDSRVIAIRPDRYHSPYTTRRSPQGVRRSANYLISLALRAHRTQNAGLFVLYLLHHRTTNKLSGKSDEYRITRFDPVLLLYDGRPPADLVVLGRKFDAVSQSSVRGLHLRIDGTARRCLVVSVGQEW